MDNLIKYKTLISREINQKETLQKNLIIKVLSSRRLLSEHVEILEESLNDLAKDDTEDSNIITFLKTSGVIATSFCIFQCMNSSFRYILPLISGGMPVVYLKKLVNINKRLCYEFQLKDLITSLDNFEFSLKKATTFMNDAQVMSVQAKILKRYNKDNKIPSILIETVKRTIRALYCFVKYLEYYYKLDHKLQRLYQEIEDVDNCLTMRTQMDEWDGKIIKDFFSLFAYVQSFMLLRLGLIFASNLEDGMFLLSKKILDITSKVQTQTKMLPNFLDINNCIPFMERNIQKQIDEEIMKMVPKELISIRTAATDLALKTFSLSLQSQEFEAAVTNLIENPIKKEQNDLLNYLESIGIQLSICSDDFNRLLITTNKYFNKTFEDEVKDDAIQGNDEMEENALGTIVKEDDEVESQKDDFFYVDPNNDTYDVESQGDGLPIQTNAEIDEEELHIQITKKTFKPVLKQLKERIVVIGEDMKEREKKVLKEKGIEIAEEPKAESKNDLNVEYGSGDSGDEYERQKQRRKQDKFNESREFLQSKLQFNFFEPTMPIPIQKSSMKRMNEEILE